VAAHALTDRIVELGDVRGRAGAALCAELLDRISSESLRAPSRRSSRHQRHWLAAVRLLEGDDVRVERLGVTARHLRRGFAEHVGIGPKELARSVRLQRAVRMTATSSDWGRIAAAAGYLIAEFRELVGLTPGAFLKRTATSEAA
jgi:AraC-like DNA-binding protein